MPAGENLIKFNQLNGAQGRNRTTDTAIFSRMLYQLSYLGPHAVWPMRMRIAGL
jgi:hypothetical protein